MIDYMTCKSKHWRPYRVLKLQFQRYSQPLVRKIDMNWDLNIFQKRLEKARQIRAEKKADEIAINKQLDDEFQSIKDLNETVMSLLQI